MPDRHRPSRARALRSLLFAAFLTIALGAVAAGIGPSPLPPLGPAFNPGTGVWTAAADARLPSNGTLRIAGLRDRTLVLFDRNGSAHVWADNDHDLFLAMGYLHARFRLFQMDLERRQGEGRLSEVVGAQALPLDRFELSLGLQRTAQAELRTLRGGSLQVLRAYAEGVNARIEEDRRNRTIPFLFHMLGYTPTPWTPLDTLVVQGDETQDLDFTDAPLDYAVLVRTLGQERTRRWFPVIPPNQQHPYDPGPYHHHAVTPLPAQVQLSGKDLRSIAALRGTMQALGVLAQGGNSNNWAVSGAKTASGKPLMAGDPHLHQTLPAIWYEISLDSPRYHVRGVSIPGTPGIVIGRNRHISWSETNTQNQVTLFYLERTDRHHPHQYFWKGAWHPMRRISYDIPVKGGRASHIEVDLTVHGPIINDERMKGRTISTYWIGNLPSDDLGALLGIARASRFSQFREALRGWHAPSQNFVYADDAGHIGLIAPGYYPLVKAGAPWLPLPGTGESDVVGTIPFEDVPQVYDPPSHFLFSANQRPVGKDYPYYIGTSLDFFDNGYRADRIYEVLHAGKKLTLRDMERLQQDTHDYLWSRLRASLGLRRLAQSAHSTPVSRASTMLLNWNGAMDAGSPAAALWWIFLDRYLRDTFDPWWKAYHVPSGKYDSLSVRPGLAPLVEDIETWTLHDPSNPAFSLPDGKKRTARDVIRKALTEAVGDLTKRFGSNMSTWRWGRLHTREFPSLAQIPGLGYGPRASGSDLWTVNAASGEFQSEAGPSWRMIVDWGRGMAEGVYPGGQSENPASPWYENEIASWWSGTYHVLTDAAAAQRQRDVVTWSLEP